MHTFLCLGTPPREERLLEAVFRSLPFQDLNLLLRKHKDLLQKHFSVHEIKGERMLMLEGRLPVSPSAAWLPSPGGEGFPTATMTATADASACCEPAAPAHMQLQESNLCFPPALSRVTFSNARGLLALKEGTRARGKSDVIRRLLLQAKYEKICLAAHHLEGVQKWQPEISSHSCAVQTESWKQMCRV